MPLSKYQHTLPTLIIIISNTIQRLGTFKVSIFLRLVLLEGTKGIPKWQVMHKLRLRASRVICSVQVTLTYF